MNKHPINLEQELLPPPLLVKDGSSSMASYREVGEHFRRLFERHLPLAPNMRVLEMGACVGRISRQFIPLLSEEGHFTGIDLLPEQIAWCEKEIGGRFPHFQFIRADIYNAEYNPQGTIKADEYRFPFEDNELDLVVLTSVFTHMLRHDVDHYLAEIFRTLKPGGHVFATFFLFRPDEFPRIFTEDASPRFLFPVYKKGSLPLCICANDEALEEAVAYEEEFIRDMVERNGLVIRERLMGNWLKRDGACPTYQDALILSKP